MSYELVLRPRATLLVRIWDTRYMRRLTLKSCGHSGTDRIKSHTVSIHTTVGTNQLSDRKRIQTVEDEIDVLCGRLLLAHVKCGLEGPLDFADPFILTRSSAYVHATDLARKDSHCTSHS